MNKITILGTGTSTGIPMLGCSCIVCTSPDHRDQRMRTSIYFETKKGHKILVDTSPDLRTQLLDNKISAIDSVIITHEHADHIHGIDDLRPFCFGPPPREIPLYVNTQTNELLKERFPYIFKTHNKPILGGGIPRVTPIVVELEKTVSVAGEDFYFFNYPHGHGVTMGFIHDDFAYVVDCMELPDKIINELKKRNLSLLILDCLQRKAHTTHLTVEKSFEYIKRISPKKTGLIHIGHDLSHREISALAQKEFGDSVFPLYDGQKLFY